MEPFPGDEIREGEAGVCAEQLGKMAAGESAVPKYTSTPISKRNIKAHKK